MSNSFNKLDATAVKGTYSFISLGCPKNLVDSERMLGLLRLDGYELVQEPAGVDFVVINTCGFIEQARDESYGTIREMLELKRRGDVKAVIVSGCLAERQKEALLDELPEVDYLVGVFSREEITRVADRIIGSMNEQRWVFQPAPSTAMTDRSRFRITPRHFAYLKISEGCDRLCTFCSIPSMRGKHVSKPIDQILAEARELAADSVRELVLVAQDTTYYGMDSCGRPRLADLLTQLNQVDGIEWIRLMYLYPMYFDEKLIDVIAKSEKIVPYLDMPLQHINDKMLRRMQRNINRAQTVQLLETLRSKIESLVLRTTFLTGFPGETQEQFDELLDFVRREKFQRVGVFTYSREPKTPADRLTGHLSEAVKNARRDLLMSAQQQIAIDWNRAQIGHRLDVLIDSRVPDQDNAWVGRSYADAPDVDGVVYVTGEDLAVGKIEVGKIEVGKIVETEIVDSCEYDLVGVAVGEVR